LQQWETQTLWQAVRQLSLIDQEIIYLRYFLELSVAETTEATGIAPGTVKSRLHRALERLRKVIAAEFPALQEKRGG
jgi:RNA polymerase sigma-70 factor (ECF subfamily)